jgi:hypothetical protein
MAGTVISGYLYPYQERLVFYPIDILYLQNNNLTELDYYKSGNNQVGQGSRFNNLMYSLNLISINGLEQSQLDIQSNRFDLNVLPGCKNFLTNEEYSFYGNVSGLLFIPTKGKYLIGKTNTRLLMWSDTLTNFSREFSAQIDEIEGSDIRLKIENHAINIGNNLIKISKVFINKNKLKVGDYVLFRINIGPDGKIDQRIPLIPLEMVSENIYNYSEVLNNIESITNPIPRNYFLG